MSGIYLELAERIAGEIPELDRPTLDEFRRFRHLVRNVYTFNLVPEKMENLVLTLPTLWLQLRAELLSIADYLRALADVARTKS